MHSLLFVVPCSQTKSQLLKETPLPARDAYHGQAFLMARQRLESAKAKWCILSGGYGFLWPDTKIEWHDEKMDPDPHRPWDGEFDFLKQKQYGRLFSATRIIVLGSRLYARSAAVMLGKPIEAPFAGLPIGKMLAEIKNGNWIPANR